MNTYDKVTHMTTDTPTPTEATNSTDKAAMLIAYDEQLRDLFTFNFAKLDDFTTKMGAVRDMCEDPLGRAAIEGLIDRVQTGAFKDGKEGERLMVVIDQRLIDAMLDLRGVLEG